MVEPISRALGREVDRVYDGRVGATQIDVEVLSLHSPVRRKSPLDASTSGPTGTSVTRASKEVSRRSRIVHIADRGLHTAKRKAAGPVKQHIVDSKTNSTACCTKPVDMIPTRRDTWISETTAWENNGSGTADISSLDIGFKSKYEVGSLPVITDLTTAEISFVLCAEEGGCSAVCYGLGKTGSEGVKGAARIAPKWVRSPRMK